MNSNQNCSVKSPESNNELVTNEKKPKLTGRPEQCSFYVQKKKRLCRMNKLKDQEFCAEHVPTVSTTDSLQESGENSVSTRIPCPLDPKHTVAVGKLKDHLKKCNSRPPDNKDYYKQAANVVVEQVDKDELNILTMSQTDKIELIIALVKFHKANGPKIYNELGSHSSLMEDFVRTDIGESALRHSAQISSLAKLMDDSNLFKDSTCFIEFGSGRGGLSYGLARVIKAKGLKNCKFILIDRTSPRYKKDNLVKTSDYKDVQVQRIKISIEDLLVGKLPNISDYEHIVGVAKHLCGAATDLALRSLLDESSNSERSKVKGLVFATCCHHRIEYKDLMGNEFLTEEFAGGRFRALRQVAAWATNGDYKSTFMKDYFSIDEPTIKFFNDAEEVYPEVKLKKTVGRLVKEILDNCRVESIKKCSEDINLSAKLVNYVDPIVTRENVAILAYPISR